MVGERSDNFDDIWMTKKHKTSVVVVVRERTKRFGSDCNVWVQFTCGLSSDGHDRLK